MKTEGAIMSDQRLSQRELRNLDDMIHRSSMRDMWRKKIERAYQRAMDIRDSIPSRGGRNFYVIESKYLAAYLRAYRAGDGRGFSAVTRRYLRAIREDAKR